MTRIYYAAAVILIVLAFSASALLYPRLPQTVPIHWNIHGEVDGYGDKSLGLFLMPFLMVLLLGLIRALPWLSPRRFGVDGFRSTWLFIMVAVVGSPMRWAVSMTSSQSSDIVFKGEIRRRTSSTRISPPPPGMLFSPASFSRRSTSSSGSPETFTMC